MALLQPARAPLLRDPVVEEVQRIGVALAQGKRLAARIVELIEGHRQDVRVAVRLPVRGRLRGHRGVGVAVQHFLRRCAVLVEQQQLRLGELPRDDRGGRGPATGGKDHVGRVVILQAHALGHFRIGQDRQAREGVGVGEVHRQVPGRRDRHAGNDDVEIAAQKRGDDAVPGGRHKLDLDAHIRGQLTAHIQLEADQFAVHVAHRPRHEERQADADHALLLDAFDDAFAGQGLRRALRAGGQGEAHGGDRAQGGPEYSACQCHVVSLLVGRFLGLVSGYWSTAYLFSRKDTPTDRIRVTAM